MCHEVEVTVLTRITCEQVPLVQGQQGGQEASGPALVSLGLLGCGRPVHSGRFLDASCQRQA